MDRAQRGEYTLVGVIRGALAYYEDQLSKNNKAAVASRATEARTREIELILQERSRELILMEDAKAVMGEMTALVLAELLGLAARYTGSTTSSTPRAIHMVRPRSRRAGSAPRA
ncbi:hypothetical protein [Roseicyclus sp.]